MDQTCSETLNNTSYYVPPATGVDRTAEAVFGWNPFAASGTGKPANVVQPLPQWAQTNHEIMQLTDLYQQQLAELVAAHSLLMDDQESFAAMLAPLMRKDGSFEQPPDENILLLKRGLDLRLLEFEEDCRRIQQTERRLQRKIDDCTLTYETSLIEARGYAEMRLIEQIQHQQKLIEYQQHELDELRFQRDLYSDETLRLRQLCRFGDFRHPDRTGAPPVERIPLPSPRTLHKEYSGAQPPFAWMRNIRHSRRLTRDKHPGTARRSATAHSRRPTAATSAAADQPFTPTFTQSERRVQLEETKQPTGTERTGFFEGMLKPLFGATQSAPSPVPSEHESVSPVTQKEKAERHDNELGLKSSAFPSTSSFAVDEHLEHPSPRSPSRSLSIASDKTAKQLSGGAGLAIGTRRFSRSSSRLSISQSPSQFLGAGSRPRSIASPRPTTLSRLSSDSRREPLSRETASKFLDA